MGSFVTRARFGVIAAFAVVALAAAGCGSSSSSSGSNGSGSTISTNANLTNGGTFNFPLYAEPVSITPLQGQESEGVSVEKNIFEGLVDYNPQTLATVPDIAKSWTHNSQNTVFTFQLRNNAAFANGEKINADTFVKDWGIACAKYTASVVAYILEPIKGYDQCVASNNAVLSGVQATGPYTLQVTLSSPFSDFVETLGHPVTWAFPPDLANTKSKQANFEKHPVGSGPFAFVSWTPNKQIIIKKSPTYTGPTPAHLNEVNFHIYPDGDENGPFLAFKSGKMQYAMIPSGQVKATESDPKLGKDVRTGPQLALYYYGFNLNTNSIIAKNLKLRQALNYATNSAAVVNNINEGIGKVADGLVPDGHAVLRAEPVALPLRPGEGEAAAEPGRYGAAAHARLQHRPRPPADRRGPDPGLQAGRPEREGRELRLGHVPGQAPEGRVLLLAPRLDRRLSLD